MEKCYEILQHLWRHFRATTGCCHMRSLSQVIPDADVDAEVCLVWFCEQIISWDFGLVCFCPQSLNCWKLLFIRETCSNDRTDLSLQKSNFLIYADIFHEFINKRNYCLTFHKDVFKTEACLKVRRCCCFNRGGVLYLICNFYMCWQVLVWR